MKSLDNATVVDSQVFGAIAGEAHEAVFEYRLTMPFQVDKAHKAAHEDEDDVVVYGPVYVGDETMLDRHRELVDAKAIIASWESYAKNPVILYNHRKDYGVIGLMEEVEMGMFEKPDGTKIEAVFGRARIDGGEKDITRKINKGMLRAFSIGFIAKAGVKQGEGDDAYLTFTEVEWIETSVVDIPASPNALFNVSKSLVSYDGEKHLIAVEERDDTFVMEFAKHEMPDEGPQEGTEMGFDADLIVELSDTIAGLEAKLAELTERIDGPIGSDTVKSHDDSQQAMTDQELATEEVMDETTEVVELAAEEETFTIKTDDAPVVETKTEEAEEEAEEEAPAEEEAEEAPAEEAEEVVEEELAEEELPEEVVEESAEEVVETKEAEEADTTVAVLSEVATSLTAVEAGLKELTARLDETEGLKALLAEREATIAELTEAKAAAEAEAEIEAEVSRRLGEKMGELGLSATPAVAKPKSLSPTTKTTTKVKSGPTKHDPVPEVSQGMASLGNWLEVRLAGKRLG